MADSKVHQLASGITCHAWNADRTQVAFCPNNNEVHIYEANASADTSTWTKLHVLKEHAQRVSAIDWCAATNMIVSCSHDRNAYVWKLNADKVWEPMLVLLLLNRAVLTVQWSPKGNKFAAGSGANSVCVCYYQESNNWWLTKKITKKHSSSVLSVAWHPNNVLLATTSSDNKCRVFAVHIKGVDAAEDAQESVFGDLKFGEPVLELDTAVGWVHAVKWSPSGTKLAYTAHDSSVYYVNNVGPSAKVQALRLPYLPLRDLLFLSETRVLAVGYDCELLLFGVNNATGELSLLECIDQVAKSAGGKAGSQFTAAFEKFHIQDTKGQETGAADPPPTTQHINCISCIRSMVPAGSARINKFSTSGYDGRLILWDVSKVPNAAG